MAFALIDPANSLNPPNANPLIGESYDLKLTQSIQSVLAEIQKENPIFSHFIQEFFVLMQARLDPPLESIWVYAALTFCSRNHPKDGPLDRISATKDLFQLISACSAPCSSSKSIALLAPVVHEVYNAVVDLFKRDLSSKREKKVMKEVNSLMGVILGYINLCSCMDMGEDDGLTGLNLVTPVSDLIRIWMNSNEGLEFFFPLVSSDVLRGISERGGDVGYFAGVVTAEAFFFKLCLNFKVGTSREELETELRTWAIASITGFQNFHLLEVLVTMLLEKTFPVTSLLSSEDEVLLRKVLYDAIILPEYSSLNPERAIHIPAEHMKSIAMKRLIVTHEAVEYLREHGDQRRALSYITAFSSSHLSSQIIKWVKNQIPVEDSAIRSKGTSPKALLKWLLNLEDQGLRVFDDSILKFRTKLVLDISKPDSDQLASKLGSKKVDDDLLFYIDNKGEEEHTDEENEKVNESVSAALVAAAQTMKSTEKRGKKRKEGKNAEKKEKIKFVKYDLCHNSDSAGVRSSFIGNDDLSSGSEPLSDEDTDSKEQ